VERICVGWAADEWGIISTVGNLIVTVAHSSTVGAGVFVFKASSKTVCGGATSAWRTGLEAMDFSRVYSWPLMEDLSTAIMDPASGTLDLCEKSFV